MGRTSKHPELGYRLANNKRATTHSACCGTIFPAGRPSMDLIAPAGMHGSHDVELQLIISMLQRLWRYCVPSRRRSIMKTGRERRPVALSSSVQEGICRGWPIRLLKRRRRHEIAHVLMLEKSCVLGRHRIFILLMLKRLCGSAGPPPSYASITLGFCKLEDRRSGIFIGQKPKWECLDGWISAHSAAHPS